MSKTPTELTPAQVAGAKATELTIKMNCLVKPILFFDEKTNTTLVGYIKEPNRMTKLRMLDKAVLGSYTASAEVYDAILIKEESDPRLYSESPEDDKCYFGGVQATFALVEILQNQLKKN